MNNLTGTAAKLAPKPMTISVKARQFLIGVTGFSALMVAKSELDKQSTKQTINLKKERLSMVRNIPILKTHPFLASLRIERRRTRQLPMEP